jgi:hypothetical protein
MMGYFSPIRQIAFTASMFSVVSLLYVLDLGILAKPNFKVYESK